MIATSILVVFAFAFFAFWAKEIEDIYDPSHSGFALFAPFFAAHPRSLKTCGPTRACRFPDSVYRGLPGCRLAGTVGRVVADFRVVLVA